MEDWKAIYASKLTTADEAVRQIPNGSRVFFGHAANEPPVLVDALVRNYEQYKDVEIVHMVAMGKGEYCKPEYAENFRHNAFFVGGSTRDAIAEGRGDFTPSFFFEIPRQFSTTMPVDVAMVMVTPPDENGMCSLGVSVDYSQEAVKQAKTVIAQVNPQMPWTGPYSLVSVEDLDCIVEHEAPLIELAPPKICQYIYELSDMFNQFYRDNIILGETDKEKQASWISLITLTRQVLETCIQILGFEAPDWM